MNHIITQEGGGQTTYTWAPRLFNSGGPKYKPLAKHAQYELQIRCMSRANNLIGFGVVMLLTFNLLNTSNTGFMSRTVRL